MKYEEPETMKELHRIREKLYEEMKDMTTDERVRWINEQAENFEKEFGLKLRKRATVKQ